MTMNSNETFIEGDLSSALDTNGYQNKWDKKSFNMKYNK